MRHQEFSNHFSTTFFLAVLWSFAFLRLASGQTTTLYNFSGPDGYAPVGNLIQDAAGNFYGVTNVGGGCPWFNGCGTVFELTKDGREIVIHDFNPSKYPGDGAYPAAGLVFDSEGNLYGTTSSGGYHAYQAGTVFKLSRNIEGGGWTERILYKFCPAGGNCTDGWNPFSSLVLDDKGNLYGTTMAGGSDGNANCGGVVFQLSPTSGGDYTESVLHSFGRQWGGCSAVGGVTIDSAGNLYGTTEFGGVECNGYVYGCGLVYKLSPAQNAWKYRVILNFTGLDGANPVANLILDSSGTLYGTASYGGLLGPCITTSIYQAVNPFGCGTVFQLSPRDDGYTEAVIYRFAGGNDGANPGNELSMDSSGNLYGATLGGGGIHCMLQGCGTAFELTRASNGNWGEVILNRFNGQNGAVPKAGLSVKGSPAAPLGKRGCIGNCVGSCSAGGAYGAGVIYAIH